MKMIIFCDTRHMSPEILSKCARCSRLISKEKIAFDNPCICRDCFSANTDPIINPTKLPPCDDKKLYECLVSINCISKYRKKLTAADRLKIDILRRWHFVCLDTNNNLIKTEAGKAYINGYRKKRLVANEIVLWQAYRWDAAFRIIVNYIYGTMEETLDVKKIQECLLLECPDDETKNDLQKEDINNSNSTVWNISRWLQRIGAVKCIGNNLTIKILKREDCSSEIFAVALSDKYFDFKRAHKSKERLLPDLRKIIVTRLLISPKCFRNKLSEAIRMFPHKLILSKTNNELLKFRVPITFSDFKLL